MPTVIIYWSPGRTPRQKEDVIREITDTLVTKGNAVREDVLIIFQEIKPGDAGRGGRLLNSRQAAGDDGSGSTAP
jgi:4-oxalocrotonate tautomerase family enzyme